MDRVDCESLYTLETPDGCNWLRDNAGVFGNTLYYRLHQLSVLIQLLDLQSIHMLELEDDRECWL